MECYGSPKITKMDQKEKEPCSSGQFWLLECCRPPQNYKNIESSEIAIPPLVIFRSLLKRFQGLQAFLYAPRKGDLLWPAGGINIF